MLFYITKWAIVYLILIFLAHQIYLFFEKNLTTTKIKDYYNLPSTEYSKINSILSSSGNNERQNNEYNDTPANIYADIFNDSYSNNVNVGSENFNINNAIDKHMKNELKDFLNNIK